MAGKLEELTQKIYQDGVTKANKESEQIINDAKKQAEDIVKNAKKEAQEIKDNARNEAEDTHRKIENELKQSYQQTLRQIQQKITDLIVTKVTQDPVKEAFKDNGFVKKIIETALKNWVQDQSKVDLMLLLPEGQEKDLAEYFEAHTKGLLNGTLDIEIDPDLKSGFKIGPADGSYQITFKEDDFQNLFRKYIRPKTIELLFGEKK
jgi:V/A-type H+-transporting ATPase subunit E